MEILAATAGTTAAAGTAATGASMSLGTILSLGMTGASAFGQIMAGQQQAAMSRFQARQADLQAKLDGIKGREQALQIRQKLERDLAGANAAFGSRGLLGEGSSLAAVQAGKERATLDIEAARFGAANAADASRAQAGQYRAQASSQASGGFLGAVSTIGDNRYIRSLIS